MADLSWTGVGAVLDRRWCRDTGGAVLEVKQCWCGVVREMEQSRFSVSDHAMRMQRSSRAVSVLRWCGIRPELCQCRALM